MKNPLLLPLPLILGAGLLSAVALPLRAQQAPAAPASEEAAAPGPFDTLCGAEGEWEITPEVFEKTYGRLGLQWLDKEKTRAQFTVRSRRGEGEKAPGLLGHKVPLVEVLADFAAGKLNRVRFAVYTRGDSGEVGKDEFEALVEKTKTAVTARAGGTAKERDRSESPKSAVKISGFTWQDKTSAYLMEYSFRRAMGREPFRPEFVRLTVVPATSEKRAIGSSGAQPGAGGPGRGALPANVQRGENGDVFIGNVPMVDQGQKGYCAVATTERVLRYYNIPVDQHEMAQVADSSSGGGTNPGKMVEALDKLEGRFKFRMKKVMPWDYGEFTRMLSDYNRAAKSEKKKVIPLESGGVIDIGEIYSLMDGEVLKKTKAKAGPMKRFNRIVHDYIDIGVPLMWGVHLGLIKEGNLPQSGGGHMRLIIGYNEKTGELLFSDSWGAGHELKRMPAEDAWTITDSLYAIEPSKA